MTGNPAMQDRRSKHKKRNIGIAWSLAECYNISRKTSQVEIW